jgi:CRP-like cAMP-binding protein
MPVSENSSPAICNKILLSLTRTSLEKVLPEFEVISLPLGTELFKAGDTVDSAFFVNSGLTSIIAVNSIGNSIEVGAVGKEGILPIEALSNLQHSAHRVVVQLPGSAFRISTAALNHNFSDDMAFCKKSLVFLQQLNNQATQLVLCNRFHTVKQRLCRWLLMTSDWAEEDQFPLTHEFLSLMLGVNRSTVSLELGALKSGGLISYRQRLIKMTDKRRIAAMSCECYWTHKRDMDAYTKALLVPEGSGKGSGTSHNRSGGSRWIRTHRQTHTDLSR